MLRFKCFRQVRRLTISAVQVIEIMLDMQGKDGRLDPSIETLATRAGVDPSTVVRALARLREFGFVTWARRLVRKGDRVEQASNAYVLSVPGTPDLHFARGVFPGLKSTTYKPVSRARECWLCDEEARENAARQLEGLGYPDQAAQMRA